MLNLDVEIPELIRKKYSSLQSIKRSINNDTYTISKDYINLRVVTFAQACAEENANTYQTDDKLTSNLQDAAKIFDYETGTDQVKKVAIYGRAGVGKSTLCQYLSVAWHERKLWDGKFDALICLSLKDIINTLNPADTARGNLALCVRSQCIDDTDLMPAVEEICKYLSDNKDRVLILLDGYDEISQSLEGNSALQKMFKLVFREYHVIITSRPIPIKISFDASSGGLVEFDKELQSMGFTRENIRSYIKTYCKEYSEQLTQFIESNTDVHNIARIPLNLELICNSWDPEVADQKSCTIVKLYSDLTTKLLLYADGKEKVAPIEKATRDKALVGLLGKIALELMKAGKGELTLNRLRELVALATEESGLTGLFTRVLNLGVLKTAKKDIRDGDNKASFIHHTFQEYFAALSIAGELEAYENDDGADMLQSLEYKYSPYYETMWAFVVGILYNNCSTNKKVRPQDQYLPLLQFWDLFEDEPRELLGITHDTLRMKLLAELPAEDTTKDNKTSGIQDYLKKDSLEPLQKLREKLIDVSHVIPKLLAIIGSGAEPATRLYAIDAIVGLQAKTDLVIFKLREVMQKDEVEGVRLYAAEGLLRLGCSSMEALSVICKGPEHLKKYILAALSRVYEVEGLDLKIKQEIEDHITKETSTALSRQLPTQNPNIAQLQQIDFISLALATNNYKKNSIMRSASNDATNVLGFLMAGFSIAGVGQVFHIAASAANFAKTAAVLESAFIGAAKIFGTGTGLGIYYIAGHTLYHLAYSQIFYSISPELDKLMLSNDTNKLNSICSKANDNSETIMAWGREGLLNIALAIRLYRHSSNTAWLKPMEDFQFICKVPNLLLTIRNNRIIQRSSRLTKDKAQTDAVLGSMKIAYEGAGFSTRLLDHYLSGYDLGVSKIKDRKRYEQKRMAAMAMKIYDRPQGFTELHIAAIEGDINKVIAILDQGEVDIDDQNNEAGDTALMIAVRNRHWKAVEMLVESGADIAFCNKTGQNAINMAIGLPNQDQLDRSYVNYLMSKCNLKEARLQKLLIEAIGDYAQAQNREGEETVMASLVMRLVKLKGWRQNTVITTRYRMYLEDVISADIDHADHASSSGSVLIQLYPGGPHEYQSVRLQIYLELYITLILRLTTNLPKKKDGKYCDLDKVCSKLYSEIGLITGAIVLGQDQLRLQSTKSIAEEKARTILSKVSKLQVGEEYVISTGCDTHAVYVALHKLAMDRVLIRVDNRYLNCGIVRKLHGREPYSITKSEFEIDHDPTAFGAMIERRNSYIKPYCVGILDLNEDMPKQQLYHYIIKLLLNNYNLEQKYQDIYGVTMDIERPDSLNEYINSWPYYPQQTRGGLNCTISSYNLGILARHGMEFFKWLKNKELDALPPLIPAAKTFVQLVNNNSSTHGKYYE